MSRGAGTLPPSSRQNSSIRIDELIRFRRFRRRELQRIVRCSWLSCQPVGPTAAGACKWKKRWSTGSPPRGYETGVGARRCERVVAPPDSRTPWLTSCFGGFISHGGLGV